MTRKTCTFWVRNEHIMIEISTHPGDAIFVERMAAGNGLCGIPVSIRQNDRVLVLLERKKTSA